MSKDSKKRKRKEFSFTLVPEEERIFQGKTFYFIPPNDVAPLRRARITKARSFGAIWTKEWIPGITHVVVEKDLTREDVMKFVKSELRVCSLLSIP
jgi:DNA polymerase IV